MLIEHVHMAKECKYPYCASVNMYLVVFIYFNDIFVNYTRFNIIDNNNLIGLIRIRLKPAWSTREPQL